MKNFKIGILVLLLGLSISKPVKAEDAPPALPPGFSSIFELIEKMVFGEMGLIAPSQFAVGGCTATIIPGFPTSLIKIPHTPTCPIAGDIVIGVLPMRVSVDLDVYGMPPVQSVKFDAYATLRRSSDKTLYFNWQVLNGSVAVALIENSAPVEMNFNGKGARVKKGGIFNRSGELTAQSRFNIFEKQSAAGYSFLRNIKKANGSFETRERQWCTLINAELNNPTGGQLLDCRIF